MSASPRPRLPPVSWRRRRASAAARAVAGSVATYSSGADQSDAPNRSASTPWRSPRSLTVSESAPSLSITVRTMQTPARITSARLGWRPTIGSACLRVARAVQIELAIDLAAVEHRALHDIRVVCRHRVADGRHVRDRPAHPDQGIGMRPSVELCEVGRDRRQRLVEHVGRDRAVQPEALGVADRPDIDAEPLVHAVPRPERELAAAATGVEHHERAPRETDPLLDREVGQAALLLARDDLDGHPGAALDLRDDRVAVPRRSAAPRSRRPRWPARPPASPRRPSPRSPPRSDRARRARSHRSPRCPRRAGSARRDRSRGATSRRHRARRRGT